MQPGEAQAWIFTGLVYILVFGGILTYSLMHWRMSQREKGPKDFLKELGYIALGWLKHWRLLVAVPIIAIGLAIIPSSIRYHTFEAVTGYRYVLDITYGSALTLVGGARGNIFISAQDIIDAIKTGQGFTVPFWAWMKEIEYGSFIRDARLLEFPVTTHIQLLYLDSGLLLLGLLLIVVGLIFGAYHAVTVNNNALKVCGEHTAKFWANWYRMAGYDVDEEYERSIAEFYMTGKRPKI
ncbi:MAG: hypothetical protein QXE50_06020 [Nitrososphaerota archaeon]